MNNFPSIDSILDVPLSLFPSNLKAFHDWSKQSFRQKRTHRYLKKINRYTLSQLLIHTLAIRIFSNFSALQASSLFSQSSLLSTLTYILHTSEIRSLQNLVNLTSSFLSTEYLNPSNWLPYSSGFSSPRSLSEMERLNVRRCFMFSSVSILQGKSLFLWCEWLDKSITHEQWILMHITR